jgi:hypothetical protein
MQDRQLFVKIPSHSKHGKVHLSQILVLWFLKNPKGHSLIQEFSYKYNIPTHDVH